LAVGVARTGTMAGVDADVVVVTHLFAPERASLIELLSVLTAGQWQRMSQSPWNFGGGPTGDQAASSLAGVTVVMVASSAARSAGRCR
jgi:hypothetical protein